MKRHTDRKQTQWQGQMHYVLFHSWLNPPFIFSRLSHLAPHQFYDLFMFSALKPLFLSLSILPSSSSRLLPPLSVSVSPSLSFCPFSFPLLCPPSLLLPAALPTRSHSPRSHTQAASSPLHFYLHTHLFTPPSQLLSPPSFFRHLLTHIIPRISPVCCLSRSPPSLPIPPSFSLTHSLNLAVLPNAHVHTPMLIGTQGQSTLSPKPASRRFDLVASTLLDTELSWGRGPGRGHGAQPLPCFSPKREHLEHRAESLWSCPGMPSRTTTRHLL